MENKSVPFFFRKAAGVGKFSDIEEALEAALKVVLGGVKDAA